MSRSRRSTCVAGAVAAVMLAVTGLATGARAASPAARESRPGKLERLAVEQSTLWADAFVGTFSGPLSPGGCDYPQPDEDNFLLPVNAGGGAPASVACNVTGFDHAIADLGGFVIFEDANGTAGGWTLANGTTLAFTPGNLVAICNDLVATQVPVPTVTLDGSRRGLRPVKVITQPFTYHVPSGWAFEDDSALLGHPGTLAASYCGYKLVVPELDHGTHTLIGTAFDRTITWTLTTN